MNLPMHGAEVFLLIPALVVYMLSRCGHNSPEIKRITPRVSNRRPAYRLRLVYSKGIDPHSYDPLDSAREVQA